MLFKDILERAKPYLKKDELHLYRAYCLNNGEAIEFHTDGELLFFTPEDAIQNLLNRDTIDLNGKIVTIVEVVFSVKKNRMIDIGTDHSNKESGSIAMVIDKLSMKEMHIHDYRVDSIDILIDERTEIKTLVDVELTKDFELTKF